jgi:CHAT domain-containing protein
VHLIRSLRLFNRAEFAAAALGDKDAIRVLLVTASPGGLGQIDTFKEERMLRFIIEESPNLGNVRLEVLHDATVQRLRDTLLRFKPHIVHMACHGGYNQEEDLGFVALVSPDDPSREDLVNSYRFATLIQEPETVQLVFVNTCFGALQGNLFAFSGIAQCLHAIGTPDVVALQFVLQDRTAHAIVLNFYRYLLREGLSVEDAVTTVRRHLFMNGYIFPESFGLMSVQFLRQLFITCTRWDM